MLRTMIFIEQDHLEMVGGNIYFDRTPVHFGGERLWFFCPNCDSRCAVLYGFDFVCKHCIGFHYGCQLEDDSARARRKLEKFKAKTFGAADPGIKPPQQHRWTHIRNLKRLCELQEKRNGLMMVDLAVMKQKLTSSPA